MIVDPHLREVVERMVEEKAAHVIDLTLRGERGTRVLELFIDSEEGVTSDLCSAVSRHVSAGIDEHRLVEGSYRLDVSSPGIERPLKFFWQYRKHIGRKLEVRARASGAVATHSGRLASVDEKGIVLETGTKDEHVSIPFVDLEEARVKAPW